MKGLKVSYKKMINQRWFAKLLKAKYLKAIDQSKYDDKCGNRWGEGKTTDLRGN